MLPFSQCTFQSANFKPSESEIGWQKSNAILWPAISGPPGPGPRPHFLQGPGPVPRFVLETSGPIGTLLM